MPIPSDCFARNCSEFMIVDLVMSPALILSDQYKKFLGFVLNICKMLSAFYSEQASYHF